ncbi:MotA/TolQ/ExbB proton channel family protein [Devosia sp. CN2-171]|uniref:MotA/TolQ/ExbB proton channel family protein n=1 Tax=Devosia sp. CN2-171 TaxID=3400909 RepID=UPI003BF915F8
MAKRHANAARPLDRFRPIAAVIGALAGLGIILLLNVTLDDYWATIFIGRHSPTDPWSVQNAMWVAFGVAIAELVVRYFNARMEERQMGLGLLPEDERAVIVAADLGTIYAEVRATPDAGRAFLPRLIQRIALQFQAGNSVEQSATLLNTSMEMFLHEVDLRYNMIRYLSWFIPSLGFIGTVIGIGAALEEAARAEPNDPMLLVHVTEKLAVSFNGTLLALLLASIIVFAQSVIQSREEHALNTAGQYCLDNLINRLYAAPGSAALK